MGCGASTAVAETPADEKKLQLDPAETSQPATEKPPVAEPPRRRNPSLATVGSNGSVVVSDPFAEGTPVPRTVDQWLDTIRLQEYAPAFKAAGLTTMVKVAQMTEADLARAGISKVGHKKKFIKQKELLETHMARQTVSDSPAVRETPAKKQAPVAPIGKLEVDTADEGRMAALHTLRSDDAVPELLTDLPLTDGKGARVQIYKGFHAANAPCEDRHTVVHGISFIFAGVWDGHAGHHCSQFAEEQVFLNLKREVELASASELAAEGGLKGPFEQAFHQTDRQFLAEAKRKVREKEAKGSYLFAGTCAVGAYCDLATRKVSVSNLGDSRAVIGLYEPTGLRTVVMSHDHTANDSAEIRRLKHDFPADGNIRINKGGNGNVIIGGSNAHDQAHTDQEESDWRVKGICQFTRSLGDFQMKERAIATVYNDYTRGSKVIPAPKTQKRKDGSRAPPYIIPTPEFREQHIENGFLLLACDGLWDEMENEEAVSVVARLLRESETNDEDIAGKLIDYALKKAALRIASSIPDVANGVFIDVDNPTVDELKSLPQGKTTETHRSCLHDDITVVIVVFGTEEAMRQRRTSTSLYDEPTPAGMRTVKPTAVGNRKRGSVQGRKGDNNTDLMAELASEDNNALRSEINRHIIAVFDTCAAMNASQLRFIFDALDVDPKNGALSRQDAETLCDHILGESGTAAVIDALYNALDSENTGEITFENFLQFFSVSADDNTHSNNTDSSGSKGSTAAIAGFQKLYNLLAEIPLMAHLTLDEQQNLAHALTKREFADGEVIIEQAEEITTSSCMYIIDEGAAICCIDGKQVSEYQQGRYFGELALQQNQPRAATIKADGATTCSILKAWEFKWLITEKKSLRSLLEERTGRKEREDAEELKADEEAEILNILEGDGTSFRQSEV